MFNVVVQTFEFESLKIMFFSALPLKWRKRFGTQYHSCFLSPRGKARRKRTHLLPTATQTTGDRAEFKVPRSDAATIAIVTPVTLISDLAMAVISGIVFSSLCFTWEKGSSLRCVAESRFDEKTGNCTSKTCAC